MGPEPAEELFKIQPTTPEEEQEGLRILARLIARAIIKDTQTKQSSPDIKPSN